MKLKIGENIRRLRREQGMTQEDFSARMKVSAQAVSRWENGTSYPDVELIPAIAELFGIGVEELMGVRRADREQASEEAYAYLLNLHDPAEQLAYLREMHREFPRDRHLMLRIALLSNDLAELRAMVERLQASAQSNRDAALTRAVGRLVTMEEEAHLDSLLDRYTPPIDFAREFLLEERYLEQKDYEQYEWQRESNFLWLFRNLTYRLRWDPEPVRHVTTSLWSSRTLLELINVLIGISPEDAARHPVSGDGVPDLWYYTRLHAGFRYACQLSFLGRTEEALATLEDATALYEAFWRLPEGTVLTYRSPTLYRLKGTLHKERMTDGQARRIIPDFTDKPIINRYLYSPDSRSMAEQLLFFREYDPLIAPSGWEWFDAIRTHPRFLACLTRMKAFDRAEIYPEG